MVISMVNNHWIGLLMVIYMVDNGELDGNHSAAMESLCQPWRFAVDFFGVVNDRHETERSGPRISTVIVESVQNEATCTSVRSTASDVDL